MCSSLHFRPDSEKNTASIEEFFSVKRYREMKVYTSESFILPFRGVLILVGWQEVGVVLDGLSRDGIPNDEVLRYFPKLKSIQRKLARTHPSHDRQIWPNQIKSHDKRNTHRPHAGPSNSRLRMHCALIVQNNYAKETRNRGLFLRVGNQKKN